MEGDAASPPVAPACGDPPPARKRRKKGSDAPARRPRVRAEDFCILGYGEQGKLLERNYKKDFLKKMCSHYGLRVGGNKDQLQARVHDYLRLSAPAAVIQRLGRLRLLRVCAALRGPACVNRAMATNDTDFYSMASCAEIPVGQFTSVQAPDGHVYAFDVLSLSTLFSKQGRTASNPYNRQPFPEGTYANLRKLVRLSRALGQTVITRPPSSAGPVAWGAQHGFVP